MTITLQTITANQTFGVWLERTNQLIDAVSNNAVTANNSINGSVTVGNASIEGYVSSNVMAVTDNLRGGTIASPAALNVSSNVAFVNNALQINANTTATGILVSSNISFQSNASFSKPVVVTGTINLSNTVTIAGPTSFSNTVNLSNTLVVTGATTLNTVSISRVTSDLRVNGDLTVNGTTTFVGTTIATGDSIPFYDDTYTLGNTVNRFIAFTTNTSVSNALMIGSVGVTTSNTYTFNNTSVQPVDIFAKTSYRSAEYLIQMANNTNYQISKLLAVHDDTNGYVTEYGIINNGITMGVFSAIVNATSGNFELRCVPGQSGITAKIFKTMVTV